MSTTRSKLNRLRGELLLMKEHSPGLKPNFSALARETGISRQTIAKIWKDPLAPKKPRQKRKSKFDPYYEEIRKKFETTPTTIMGAFKYFQQRDTEDVFTNYDSFKSYVKANKLTEARQEFMKAHVRFETEPGHEIQVDWKESLKMTLSTGEVIEYNLFTAVYGYSRYTQFIYSPTKTTEDFLRCMIEVLNRAGGKPEVIRTDNMSAIVSVKNGKRTKLPVIRQFEKDIDTPIRLCKVRNPQSKGKVESANRFAAWLEAYQNELNSEEELIEAIETVNRQINREPSRTTGVIRAVSMIKEKEHLRPLTKELVLDSYLKDVGTQIVPNTLLVVYKGCGYSVPKKYIGQRVKLVPDENVLRIYYNNSLICTHQIAETPLNYKESDYLEALRDALPGPKEEEDLQEYEDEITRVARQSLEGMKNLKGKAK